LAKEQMHSGGERKKRGIITKEFIVGLLAIVLGGYNLYYLYTKKFLLGINLGSSFTQSLANIILVIAGLILWVTAYKLWRYKWHASRFI
jgi:hypothetical protein